MGDMFNGLPRDLAIAALIILACGFALGRCKSGCDLRVRIEHADAGAR